MESNSKIYEEDQKKELQNEKIDEEDSKMKLESLLTKGEKEKDKQDNNQDNSSFDEEFYSDVSSDNNTNENSSNLKKTKTLNDKINNKNYLNEKYKKDLRRSNYIENKLMSSITKKENANRKNLELAKSINFKSIPDKIIETDEFGQMNSAF